MLVYIMTPYQTVIRWPKRVKDRCFDLYCAGLTAPEIRDKTGVAPDTLYGWIGRHSWRQCRSALETDYKARGEMLGTASIAGVISGLTASSKVLGRVHHALDSETPLSPEELAKIAGAISDSSELLCRLLGK